jgi:hypothetical protein
MTSRLGTGNSPTFFYIAISPSYIILYIVSVSVSCLLLQTMTGQTPDPLFYVNTVVEPVVVKFIVPEWGI